MKKLMIAVAGVACACALNAATYDWKVLITDAWTADKYNENTTVYLIDKAVWEAADLTQGTALFTEGFYADKTTFAKASGKTDGSKKYETATIPGTDTAGSRALVYSDSEVPEGTKRDVYYVLVKDNGTDPAQYYAHADELTARSSTGEETLGPSYSFASATVSYADFPGGPGPGPVPEPTSGLLLLLGVAGLALKRKRA